MSATTAIRHLVLFESEELVCRLISETNPNLKKRQTQERARSVAAYVRQGRQFLELSTGADMAIRPILQYYGLVPLCRAMTIVCNDVSADSLAPSHGIRLSADKKRPVEEFELILESRGTVPDAMIVLEEHNLILIERRPHRPIKINEEPGEELEGRALRTDLGNTSPSTTGNRILVRDLFARIPEIEEDFRSVFEQDPAYHPARFFTNEEAESPEIIVWNTLDRDDAALFSSEQRARAELGIPDGLNIQVNTSLEWGAGHHLSITGNRRIDSTSWPIMYTAGNDRTFLVRPLPDSSPASPIPLMLCASFALSSIARYHPDRWREIVFGSGNDKLIPVVHGLLNIIDRELVEAIAFAIGQVRTMHDVNNTIRRVLQSTK